MQLYINPNGGIAGDMFAAALISAGAPQQQMLEALWLAASKLGKSTIDCQLTADNSSRLIMDLHHNKQHLSGHEAHHFLSSIFEELELDPIYREFGQRALQILIEAEIQAHSENHFLTDHLHHHHTENEHHHEHHHEHGHHHHHPHQTQEAWLHEAQDVLIDITGAAFGLQLLEAPVKATLLAPVSLGGGIIKFSHGEMSAPAPATKIILQKHWIPSQLGPIDVELCTPTGAAILAALGATRVETLTSANIIGSGISRGSKDLPIPPLNIILVE